MNPNTVNEYNIVLKVVGNPELHNQLQKDSEFFKKYVSENSCILDMQVPENNYQTDDWTWNKKNILHLLDSLERYKCDIKNTKVKKKDLWIKIRDEMIRHGYKNIDEITVERKFRNMKATYKTIKENRRKSATTYIKWDYFEAMDKILGDDHTTDNTHTNMSVQAELPTTVKSAGKSIDIIIEGSPIETVMIPKIEPNKSYTPEPIFCTTTPMSIHNRSSHEIPIELNTPSLSSEHTQDGVRASELPKTNKKNGRIKQLYIFRKKQLDIERQRVKELQLIREAVEKSNAIQAERNNLLKLFLEKRR